MGGIRTDATACFITSLCVRYDMANRKGGHVFEIEYLEDFLAEAAPRMVQAGVAVFKPVIRSFLNHSVGNFMWLSQPSRSSGSLLRSIRASKTFRRADGHLFVSNVFFKGNDLKGTSQDDKAFWMEYGTSNGQRPTHFARNAATATTAKVTAAMEKALEEALKTT